MGNSRKYSVLFAALLALIVAGLLYFSTTDIGKSFFELMTDSSDFLYYGYDSTVPFIEQVQEENSYTKLIVGDSVCNELFDSLQEYNDTYCIAGSNRAIGLSGQYFLISEFLKAHPGATDIYLMITQLSLRVQFDTQTGYMYEVVPFMQTDTFDVDEDIYELVEDTYGRAAMNKNVQKLLVSSPLMSKIYFSYLKRRTYVPTDSEEAVSDIAYRYLMDIVSLCEEKNVSFHMIAMPVSDLEPNHDQVEKVRETLALLTGNETVRGYADTFLYYDPELFTDGQHFDRDRTDLAQVVRDIMEYTGEFTDLKLE